MVSQAHWDDAYADGDAGVSWRQDEARVSLELIASAATDRSAPVIDIGGGASTLVDGLLAAGYEDVSVLDVSPRGLEVAKRRLGERAAEVEWIVGDLLEWRPAKQYAIWHDRAVLHFLVDDDLRAAYVRQLKAALTPGGHAVVGAFAEDGPTQCSGLPVKRFSADELRSLLGGEFSVVATRREGHVTPSGNTQPFNWVVARRS